MDKTWDQTSEPAKNASRYRPNIDLVQGASEMDRDKGGSGIVRKGTLNPMIGNNI
jgi:hypothetical protein